MFINHEGVKNSRKRKMKEVAAGPVLPSCFPRVPPVFGSPSSLQAHHLLNVGQSPSPFSFTSLLNAPDPEDYARKFAADQRNTTPLLDQIVGFHTENLKKALSGSMDKIAEDMAAKKLKEKEEEIKAKSSRIEELEEMVENYSNGIENLMCRVRTWRRHATYLRKRLHRTHLAREEVEEEEAESSCVDPDGGEGPVRMECRVCERKMARVMMWPCRHVCVCVDCNGRIKTCPACTMLKTSSVQLCFPAD